MPLLFPKAKFMAVAGQVAMAAEPVRTRRATVYVVGDDQGLQVVDAQDPFTVYVQASDSVYASTDGGAHWQQGGSVINLTRLLQDPSELLHFGLAWFLYRRNWFIRV